MSLLSLLLSCSSLRLVALAGLLLSVTVANAQNWVLIWSDEFNGPVEQN